MKKALNFITFTIIMFSLLFITANAKTIYVDKLNGNNGNDGSKSAPYRTIQKGCDNANAGDTVYVKKAEYYEIVHMKKTGTADRPITIKAEAGTVISNADPLIRINAKKNLWTLEDSSLGLYSASLELNTGDTELVTPTADALFPSRVLCDNVDIMQYPSLNALKTFVLNDNDTYYLEGYSHGYYYDASAKKIYVRLRSDGKYGSPNPNEHTMKISPTYYTTTGLGTQSYGLAPGYGSYNILVGDKYTMTASLASTKTQMPSYYVIIEGFTFETPGLAGVFLRASDVTIRNCKFYGCRYGVKGAARVMFDMAYSSNIIVEKCTYTQYPTYEDAVDFVKEVKNGTKKALDHTADSGKIKYPWWHKKSNGLEVYGIASDLRYETGGLVGNMGTNWVIRNNHMVSTFDGINGSAMTMYQEKRAYGGKNYTIYVPAENIEIYNNRFETCLDNSLEFEEHGKNIKVYNNEFINNFIPISWQPTKGPDYPTNIYVYKNLIYNTPEFGHFWSQVANYANFAIKIGAQTTNWVVPWADPKPENGERAKVTLAGNGFNIYNNTMILPYGYPVVFSISNKHGWSEFNPIFENIRIKNNVLVSHVKKAPNADAGYMWDGISAEHIGGLGSYILPDMGIEYAGNVFAPDGTDGYVSTEFTSNGGLAVHDLSAMRFNALTMRRYDIGASSDSPIYAATITDSKYGAFAGAVAKGASYAPFEFGADY